MYSLKAGVMEISSVLPEMIYWLVEWQKIDGA